MKILIQNLKHSFQISKNFFLNKTRASVLHYVLTIGLISIIVLGGFVGWVFYVVQFKQVQATEIQNQKKTHELLIRLPNEIQINVGEKHLTADAITPEIGLEIEHRFHGIFRWYSIKGVLNNKPYYKSAFYGDVPLNPSMSIMIPNNGRTLYLSGNADLSGTIYTAEGGVRSSSIGELNTNFSNKKITQANIKIGKDKLPEMASDLKHQLENLLSDHLWSDQEFTEKQGSVIHSFSKPLKIIEFNEFRSIESVQYIGNIWIRSTQPIEIGASAILKDVFITAPKITIEDGFTGQIQALASRSIQVGKNCTLQYPSALWVMEVDSLPPDIGNPKISIQSNSTVMGYVGYEQINSKKKQRTPDVFIENKATIYGQVYVMGSTELRGEIMGSLYTEHIVARHQGILYNNHLFNGKIFPEKRVTEFLDFSWSASQEKKIMQWLY